jgi:hypothetical protein
MLLCKQTTSDVTALHTTLLQPLCALQFRKNAGPSILGKQEIVGKERNDLYIRIGNYVGKPFFEKTTEIQNHRLRLKYKTSLLFS